MSRFNIGDLVQCIDEPDSKRVIQGHIYRVHSLPTGYDDERVRVQCLDDGRIIASDFYATRFVLHKARFQRNLPAWW